MYQHRCRESILLSFTLTTLVTAMFAAVLGVGVAPLNLHGNDNTNTTPAGASNFFAAQDVRLPLDFGGRLADGDHVGWALAIERAVVARREQMLRTNADTPAAFTFEFTLPDGEPKTVLSATLVIDAGTKGTFTKPLWIFPRDPFADNPPFAAETDAALFDPVGDTANRFEAAKLKFNAIENLDALARRPPELLIVGEGINFREHRALPDVLVKTAANGGHVLCLAPARGSFVLPAPDAGPSGGLEALHLRKSNVIADFDKRLDFLNWPGEGSVARSSLTLAGKRGPLTVDVIDGDGEWPWLEAEFAGGGRLIVCGFALIKRWDDGPAPRHILRHALAHAARRPPSPVVSTGDQP